MKRRWSVLLLHNKTVTLNNLTDGPITRTLLTFAIPTLLSNVLQSLNGSINTIWVGRFLGESALAATANANIITFLLFSLVFGFGMAATIMVGQSIGRKDLHQARRAFGASIGFCLFLSVVLAVLGWLFSPQILRLLATPTDAFHLAEDYLRVVFIAAPANLLMVMMMMGLRGAGDSLTPLIFMCVNVVLDIIFNPLLILGIWIFPKMGIAGAAASSSVSGYLALFAMVFYIYVKNLSLRLKGRELLYIWPDMKLTRFIIFKGFPMSLQMVIIATSGLVMIGLVNQEGVTTIAAYNIMQQLWTYLQMPSMAVGAAVSAMVAQNIGAGSWNRVSKTTLVGCVAAFVMIAILLGLLLVFDRPVIILFLGNESAAVATAQHIQALASWSFLFFGLAMVLFSTVRANGAVVVPLICLFVATYPVRLGFYYAFYPKLHADAIWLSFTVGAFAALIMAVIYYYTGSWKKGKML